MMRPDWDLTEDEQREADWHDAQDAFMAQFEPATCEDCGAAIGSADGHETRCYACALAYRDGIDELAGVYPALHALCSYLDRYGDDYDVDVEGDGYFEFGR